VSVAGMSACNMLLQYWLQRLCCHRLCDLKGLACAPQSM
jgi:hypothetical protein